MLSMQTKRNKQMENFYDSVLMYRTWKPLIWYITCGNLLISGSVYIYRTWIPLIWYIVHDNKLVLSDCFQGDFPILSDISPMGNIGVDSQ